MLDVCLYSLPDLLMNSYIFFFYDMFTEGNHVFVFRLDNMCTVSEFICS